MPHIRHGFFYTLIILARNGLKYICLESLNAIYGDFILFIFLYYHPTFHPSIVPVCEEKLQPIL